MEGTAARTLRFMRTAVHTFKSVRFTTRSFNPTRTAPHLLCRDEKRGSEELLP